MELQRQQFLALLPCIELIVEHDKIRIAMFFLIDPLRHASMIASFTLLCTCVITVLFLSLMCWDNSFLYFLGLKLQLSAVLLMQFDALTLPDFQDLRKIWMPEQLKILFWPLSTDFIMLCKAHPPGWFSRLIEGQNVADSLASFEYRNNFGISVSLRIIVLSNWRFSLSLLAWRTVSHWVATRVQKYLYVIPTMLLVQGQWKRGSRVLILPSGVLPSRWCSSSEYAMLTFW